MLSTVFAAAAAAQSYRFNSVQVEGNQRIGADTIISYTGIARGQTLSAGELNDAYQRVVQSGLFESVEFVPRGGSLVIQVQEYPTINLISFEGNRRLGDDALGEIVQSTSRRVFDPAQAERDASAIAQVYFQQGRVSTAVTPRIIRRPDNRVDLVFEIAEGNTTEIERVSFVGNKVFSDRRLRRVLETKQATFLRAFFRSDTLIEERLEFDRQVLRDFYLSRGYVDMRVLGTNAELTRERDAFFLVVNIEEGQQFRFGNITTVSEMPDVAAAAYQNALRIKPGVIYSPALVESSIARLERLAVQQGVNFLRVEPRITRNERDLTLDVEFTLVRGPRILIERIDIEGNTTTLDRVVRQQFRVVEGDAFNPREIRQSAERIRALGFFSRAEVDAREGSSPDKVVIDVDVEEQPTGSLQLGGSYSTNSGFGVAIGLSEDNFLGRGQRLSFNLSTAEESRQYALGFTEPYLLGRELRLDLNLGFTEADSSFADYETERTFFAPSLTLPISDRSSIGLRYSWTTSEMLRRGSNALASQQQTGFTIANEIATGRRRTSLVGISYTYDSRLTGLNPNAGVLFEIGADFAGLGGDNKYISTRARAIAQTRVLNEEVTLRATIEGGALSWRGGNNSRVIDRFALNPSQMRGFEPQGIGPREITTRCVSGSTCDVNAGTGTYQTDDALGGNLFAVARFEAEFSLGLPEEAGLAGSLFYDIGNLWNLDNANTTGCTGTTCNQRIVGSNGSFRQAVGFGLTWDSVLGPLRLNFTRAVSKESFDNEQSFDLTVSTRF